MAMRADSSFHFLNVKWVLVETSVACMELGHDEGLSLLEALGELKEFLERGQIMN
jgi:hypothetical protein